MKTWTRFKEQCATSKVISCLFFLIEKKFIEIIEWLHESYLKNNQVIDKLTIQNEQLLERLQEACSSSYVSDCHMVDCLEDFHDIMDHEKHEKL